MKIEIDLPESELRSAIEAQVSKLVSTLTEDVISKKAEEIIATKFDRYNPLDVMRQEIKALVSPSINKQIEDGLNEAINTSWRQDKKIQLRAMIDEQIKKFIKDAAGSAR